MGPRDWLETIKEVTKKIGDTEDTGGNQTAGTVFAKQNAIMEMLKVQDARIITNFVWKQTETKSLTVSSSGNNILSFSFEKPVIFRAIYFNITGSSTGYTPMYFINGENSLLAQGVINAARARYLIKFDGGSGMGNRILVQSALLDTGSIVENLWITQLDIHFSASSNDGVMYTAYVEYQEGQAE